MHGSHASFSNTQKDQSMQKMNFDSPCVVEKTKNKKRDNNSQNKTHTIKKLMLFFLSVYV